MGSFDSSIKYTWEKCSKLTLPREMSREEQVVLEREKQKASGELHLELAGALHWPIQ